MSNLQSQASLQKNVWPTCFVIPNKYGGTDNCTQVKLPSMSSIILILIISWILYLLVAYGIYYFLNRTNPSSKYNYWMILLILICAGLIVSLVNYLIMYI